MGLLPTPSQPGAPPPGMQPTDTPGPGRPPGPEGYVEGEQPNVTPEEQAEYDQFMTNALKLIYGGGEVKPEIVKGLEAAKDQPPAAPEEGAPDAGIMALANTAVQIVSKLDDSARQAGKPVSDDVLYHGGAAIIEDLAEVARRGGIRDFSEEEMSGALMQAIDMYRPKLIEDGRTTEDTLKQQFGELDAADKAGQLGQILPGIDQAAAAMPQAPAAPPGAPPGMPPPMPQ